MSTMTPAAETRQVNGQVKLADPAAITASPYANDELAPVPLSRRTWTTYNYLALWMGMAHNIPRYLLASGLIALGMNWLQAFLTITIANLLVLIPMLLNSHAGTKYGIPFPVFARAFYGVRGANLAALLRAFIACGWFGIQTWVGGEAIYVIIGRLVGSGWTNAGGFAGQPWTLWLSFAVVLDRADAASSGAGMNALRRFENWAAPLVRRLHCAAGLHAGQGGRDRPDPDQTGTARLGRRFWPVFGRR